MSAVWDTDYLWREVQGAKLASLFGLDQAESQGNESFQFTAPKQPKKTCTVKGPPPQKPAPPPCAPAVLFATAVHAFCFVNGQHVKQGKIGAAVLGNHATKEYKILLYGNKQKQITTARIHRGFVLTVQTCNYVTFYDDQQQNWSLMFDSEKARPEFCKQVCVCRWNSAASADSLLTQDLDQGEGQAVDAGDTVEVAFSGWLLQNHSIGQIFDSNVGKEKLQRLRLGAGKALKGWENGMLGMQKGGRRLIIVPPSVGYGSKVIPNHVPANSTLVFDVEIHRVKLCKDRRCGGSADVFSSSPGVCSDTLSEENSQVDTTDTYQTRDQAPNWKVESVNERQTMSDASKAKLISRIAKMGQPMLPFLTGAVPAQPDPSDSDTEDVSESGAVCDHFPSHSPSPKPSQMPCTSPTLLNQPDEAQKQEAVPPQTDSNTSQGFQPYSFSPNPNSPSQLNSFTSVYPSQHIPYITPDIASFLMSDARQHNQEILLAIEKLANRVDQLTYKVNTLQNEGDMSFGLSSVSLETNMILHNVQRIIQESMCLKKEVLQKSSQVEEQKHKICELTELNKRMEEQYNQTNQLQTEQEKIHVLSPSCELVNLQQRATEIQALNDKQKRCSQISLLEARVDELVKQREQFEQCWKAEKKKCKELEAAIQNMDEEMQDLRAEKENLDQVLSDRKRKWQAERERFVQEQEEEYQRSQKEIRQLLIQLRRARDATQPLVQQTELELSWQKKHDAAMAEQKELEGTIAELQKQVKRVMDEVFESVKTEFDLQESYSGHTVLHILQNIIKSITMKLPSKHLELDSNVDKDKVEEEYLSTEEEFSNENIQKEKYQIEEKAFIKRY